MQTCLPACLPVTEYLHNSGLIHFTLLQCLQDSVNLQCNVHGEIMFMCILRPDDAAPPPGRIPQSTRRTMDITPSMRYVIRAELAAADAVHEKKHQYLHRQTKLTLQSATWTVDGTCLCVPSHD